MMCYFMLIMKFSLRLAGAISILNFNSFPLTRIYFHCSVAWSHTQYVLSDIMWLHYVVTNLNV